MGLWLGRVYDISNREISFKSPTVQPFPADSNDPPQGNAWRAMALV